MKRVIDISYHNGNIDFSKVKNNCDGIILRLGYTGYGSGKIVYDKMFKTYLAEIEKYQIPYGIYYFPCSITKDEALAEADFIVRNAKQLNLSIEPIYLDSEVADSVKKQGRADNLSKAKRTELLRTIADRLKQAGFKVGVYASTSWLYNNLDMDKLSDLSVWVAQYSRNLSYYGVYDLWQYTSSGCIDGIDTKVDISEAENKIFKQVDISTPPIPNPYPEPTRTLYKKVINMRGDDIKWLQFELIRRCCLSEFNSKGKSNIDGIFGNDTLNAVKKFQNSVGITVDGIVGPVTHQKLLE